MYGSICSSGVQCTTWPVFNICITAQCAMILLESILMKLWWKFKSGKVVTNFGRGSNDFYRDLSRSFPLGCKWLTDAQWHYNKGHHDSTAWALRECRTRPDFPDHKLLHLSEAKFIPFPCYQRFSIRRIIAYSIIKITKNGFRESVLTLSERSEHPESRAPPPGAPIPTRITVCPSFLQFLLFLY